MTTPEATRLDRAKRDLSMEHVVKLLAKQGAECALYRRRYLAACARRNALALKLVHAGWTEREIAQVAMVSGPAIHQLKDRSRSR